MNILCISFPFTNVFLRTKSDSTVTNNWLFPRILDCNAKKLPPTFYFEVAKPIEKLKKKVLFNGCPYTVFPQK